MRETSEIATLPRAVSYMPARPFLHRQDNGSSVEDDSPPGLRRDRMPYLPRHGDYSVSKGLRPSRGRAAVGQSRERTTGLYDRRSDEVSRDEVERIGI